MDTRAVSGECTTRVRACTDAAINLVCSRARDQSALRMRVRDIAQARPRFGYMRILVLLRREGWAVGKKRVHRLYCLEGLQLRMRNRRSKRRSLHRGPTPVPTGRCQYWAMDFVHDQLANGRAFRVLTVI